MFIANGSISIGMNNEEFKKLLTEVAKWGLPKVEQATRNTGLTKNRRGRLPKVTESSQLDDSDSDEQEEQEQTLVKDGVNVTYAPLLLGLKPMAVDCEDCGRHCQYGRHKEAKLCESNTKKYWHQRCTTCGMHQDPYTGRFDLRGNKANAVWNSFIRSMNGKRQIQKLNGQDIVTKTKDFTQIENDQEIIKKYRD